MTYGTTHKSLVTHTTTGANCVLMILATIAVVILSKKLGTIRSFAVPPPAVIALNAVVLANCQITATTCPRALQTIGECWNCFAMNAEVLVILAVSRKDTQGAWSVALMTGHIPTCFPFAVCCFDLGFTGGVIVVTSVFITADAFVKCLVFPTPATKFFF